MGTQTVFLGRQPIVDRQLAIVAYELLYRSGDVDRAVFDDGDAATSNVLIRSTSDFGLHDIAGTMPVFINFTDKFVRGELPIPFDTGRVVIEVLENVQLDDELVAGLRRLSERGFRIALDDFVYSPAWDDCLEIADIVKLDLTVLEAWQLEEHVHRLRKLGVTLLAEKVETHDQFERCMLLGFDLFQGYFFTKPALLSTRTISPSKLAVLQTLALLNNEQADVIDIESAIAQDAVLAHKIIKYVNSSAYGLTVKIESLRQSIAYLGVRTVRDIATLFLLGSIEDKPTILVQTALIRALACKKLGAALGFAEDGAYFTVGLLSALDALLDRDLAEIVSELPVTDRLKRALTQHHGPLGQCLECVLNEERRCSALVKQLKISEAQVSSAYLSAICSVEKGEGLASLIPPSKSTLDLPHARHARKVSTADH